MAGSSDDVFIAADPGVIGEAILHAHEDPAWWPGLRARGGYAWLELDAPTVCPGRSLTRRNERVRFKVRIEDARPGEGFRWIFERGELDGAGEFWLERFRGGTIVHYFTDVRDGSRDLNARLRRHRWAIRVGLNGLKDRLEGR